MGVLAVDLKTEGVTVVNCTPGVGAHVLPDGRSGAGACEVSTAVLCIRPEPHYRCNCLHRRPQAAKGYDIIHRQNPDPRFRLRSRRSVGAVEQEARPR